MNQYRIGPKDKKNSANTVLDGRRTINYNNAFVAATSTVASSLANPSLSYARTLPSLNHIKGAFGEAYAANYLARLDSGRWVQLNPRNAPQGLDHLYVRFEKNGQMRWMVAETKFGTSTLSITKDGTRQLSEKWVRERLEKIGNDYLGVAASDIICSPKPTANIKKELIIPTKQGTISFWQDDKGQWHFSGDPKTLEEVKRVATKLGKDLLSPNASVRVRLINVSADGKKLVIKISDPNGKFQTPQTLDIDDIFKKIKELGLQGLSSDTQKIFAKKFPLLSESEVKDLVDDIFSEDNINDLLKWKKAEFYNNLRWSLITLALAVGSDIALQLFFTKKVNPKQTTVAAGAALLGYLLDAYTAPRLLLNSQAGVQITRTVASLLGVGTSAVRSAITGLGCGAVVSVFFALASWGIGLTDRRNAMVMAGTSVAGLAGGTLATTATINLVGAYGTASTGTSIAALSGIAKMNAIYSFFGGGPIAAGGLGVKGGLLVLGGIGVAATLAVGCALSFGYKRYLISTERAFHLDLIDRFNNNNVWETIAHRTIC